MKMYLYCDKKTFIKFKKQGILNNNLNNNNKEGQEIYVCVY